MALPETILVRVGTAVAGKLFRIWVERSAPLITPDSPVDEAISGEVPSLLQRRKLNRQFEQIADELVHRLEPLIENEFRLLPTSDRDAALLEVALGFEAADLTISSVVAADVDPLAIERAIRAARPNATRDFSQDGAYFYDLILRELSNYIAEILVTLPPFAAAALREILRRESALLELVRQVLAQLPARSSQRSGGLGGPLTAADRNTVFEDQYRREVARKLDWLELFGVNLSDESRRYALSVAYITLTMTVDQTRKSRGDETRSARSRQSEAHYLKVDEALASSNRILIRGEPGSGKTTLLHWLAVTAARRTFPVRGPLEDWNEVVPLVIELRRFAERELPRPREFPDQVARNIIDVMPPAWVNQLLETGRALLLIDGVDELPPERRDEARDWVESLVRTYSKCKYIVTSRPPAVGDQWLQQAKFVASELQPMAVPDIAVFIDHWHKAVATSLSSDEDLSDLDDCRVALRNAVSDSRSLRAIATTPLLCALLCALNRDSRGNLPRDRMELYQTALEMLIDRRDLQRRIRRPSFSMSFREKETLLRALAYWLILQSLSDCTRERAVDVIRRKLPMLPRITGSAEEIYEYLVLRSGVLREPVAGRVDFLHKTFQEYLAAKECTGEDHVDLLLKNALSDLWAEVIVLAAGHATRIQREQIIQGLLDRGDRARQNKYRLYLLAVACMETATELPPSLLERIAGTVTDLVPPRTMSDARALASAGDLAVEHLSQFVDADEGAVVAACVRALSLIGSTDALQALSRYSGDERPLVVREIVRGWQYFEPTKYAEVVLSNSPLYAGRLTVSDRRLLGGIRHLQHLKELTYEVRELTEAEIAEFETLNVALRLHVDDLAADFLQKLASLKSLIELQVTEGSSLSDLKGIGDLENLGELRLVECEEITDYWPLADLRQLKALYLPRSFQKSGDITVARSLQNLQELDLSGWSEVTDFSVIAELKQLRELFLRDCAQLANLDMVRACGRLRVLDIAGCERVQDLTPVSQLRSLSRLDISGTHVRDLSPLAGLRRLRRLDASGCSALVDLSPLASMTWLRTLDITDAAVTNLTPLYAREGMRIRVGLNVEVQRLPKSFKTRNNIKFVAPDEEAIDEDLLFIDPENRETWEEEADYAEVEAALSLAGRLGIDLSSVWEDDF